MKIRSFQSLDQDAVVSLWDQCDLIVPRNDPKKDIARKLLVDADLFLVGLVDDNIVATVMGGYEGHRGWANYLAVSPEFQGQGLGRQLMQCLEEKLLEKGCPKINLQIRSSNADVIAFYEALGYENDTVVSLGKRLIKD